VRHLQNIFRLGVKELRSLRHDKVLLLLVFYAFTYAIYSAATGTSSELRMPLSQWWMKITPCSPGG